MAERAKRRLTAAKLSVSFAVAAVLTGFVARDKSPASVAYQLTGSQPHAAPGTFGALKRTTESPSRGIKPHSLFYKDFAAGQVYSQKAANRLFLKYEDAKNNFLGKVDAANTYLGKDFAAATYLKIEDAQSRFISGNGKVLTGIGSSQGGLIGLLDIAGLATIQGNHDPAGQNSVQITNTSGSPIEISPPGNGNGIIAVNQSVALTITGAAPTTVQMLVPAVNKIATLTISSLPAAPGGGTDFVAQALVGAP